MKKRICVSSHSKTFRQPRSQGSRKLRSWILDNSKEDIQEIPALQPLNHALVADRQKVENEKGAKPKHLLFHEQSDIFCRDKIMFSALCLRVKKLEIQDLFDENLSLRLSGLGSLMNEVISGNFETLRAKILLNSSLYMTSISQDAISNDLVSKTLGSLTFPTGIPDIPDIDRQILDNVIRIQKCAARKISRGSHQKRKPTKIVYGRHFKLCW